MVTLADLKDWLGITTDAHDTLLQGLLGRVIDEVQRSVGWYFGEPREVTEVVSGPGRGFLYLRQPPVAGQPVVISTRASFPEEWEAVEATDYEVNGRRLLHRSLWYGDVRVTYHEGFEVTPGDVEQVILELASATWKGRTLNPEMQSETIGDYSYTRGDITKATRRVGSWAGFLARWKRGRI